MPKYNSLSFFIAKRYLFSRKSHSVINIISVVSVITVAVPVMAMIILLSTHNGLNDFLRSMYRNFDSDIQVTPVAGKVFDADSVTLGQLAAIASVKAVATTLEESALFSYNDAQYIGKIRGVDSVFHEVVPIADMVESGRYDLGDSVSAGALVGMGVAYNLNMGVRTDEPLYVYMPKRKGSMSLFSFDMYNRMPAVPTGIFTLDAETDGKYVIVPIDFARKLLGYKNKITSIEIAATEGADVEALKRGVAEVVGEGFRVMDRYEQKETLYRVVQNEKWAIYFILLLVLLLASLSLVGSIIMLIIDKKAQIETLRNMGAEQSMIRQIFVGQGMMITAIGAVVGLALGLLVCFLQIRYGLVELDSATMLLDAYPVIVEWTDVAIVVGSVVAVNYIISRATVAGTLR